METKPRLNLRQARGPDQPEKAKKASPAGPTAQSDAESNAKRSSTLSNTFQSVQPFTGATLDPAAFNPNIGSIGSAPLLHQFNTGVSANNVEIQYDIMRRTYLARIDVAIPEEVIRDIQSRSLGNEDLARQIATMYADNFAVDVRQLLIRTSGVGRQR